MMLTNTEKLKADAIIRNKGGYREKMVLTDDDRQYSIGHTWNAEHKVIDVFANWNAGNEEYEDGCRVDIVTGKICG